MSTVLLVQAPCWGEESPPLAIASLSAYLRQHDIPVYPYDFNIQCFNEAKPEYRDYWEDSLTWFWHKQENIEAFFNDHPAVIENFNKKLDDVSPSLVGFSVFSTSLHATLYLCRAIKRRNATTKIVLGGPECGLCFSGADLLRENGEFIDYVVIGEGEETLREIVAEPDRLDIPGTAIFNDDRVRLNPERPLIRRLDDLPYPDFSDFELNLYTQPTTLPMATSRGCINKCIYCNERLYWKKYRSFSGWRLFEELQFQLSRYPFMQRIGFFDSLINGNIRSLVEFSRLIIDNGLNIKWSGQATIRREMNLENLRLLKAAGCEAIGFGLESSSREVMKAVGKVLAHNVELEKFLHDCYASGIQCNLNFMFGLPGETDEVFEETLAFIRRNARYIHSVNPSPSFCLFFKGTPGYENPDMFGIEVPRDNVGYWQTKEGDNTFLVRLNRFERFLRLIDEMEMPTTYPHVKHTNRDALISEYESYLTQRQAQQ